MVAVGGSGFCEGTASSGGKDKDSDEVRVKGRDSVPEYQCQLGGVLDVFWIGAWRFT